MSPEQSRLFDAATKAARYRSFSEWAASLLTLAATTELDRAGVGWSHARGAPLNLQRKADRNVHALSVRRKVISKRKGARDGK